jgi:hypothetical protein
VSDSVETVFGVDQVDFGLNLATYSDVAALEAGGLAVLCCDSKIVVFGRSGRITAMHGGRGDGPKHFRSPRMIKLPGDTLLVYDRGTRRVSWIDPEAGVVRTLPILGDPPFTFAVPLGYQRDAGLTLGAVNTWAGIPPMEVGDTIRSQASVARIHPDSGFEELFAIPDVLLVSRLAPNDPPGITTMDHVRYAGLAIVRTNGVRLFVASGDSRAVEFRDLDGTVVSVATLPWPRLQITDAQKAEFLRAETEPLRGGGLNGHAPPPNVGASLRFLEKAMFSDSFPVLLDLIPTLRGEGVWALHGGERRAPSWEATFIEGDGTVGATLRADVPDSRPLGFDDGVVIIARSDSDGVTWFERRSFDSGLIQQSSSRP